jgi:hypothetical protein
MAKYQRRAVLKMTAGCSAVVTGGPVLGTARTASTVTVSGTVVAADGDPAGDVTMEASTNQHPRATTDSEGRFSLEVSANSQFYLGMYEYKSDSTPPKRDGVPFMYDFGEHSVSGEDVDLGALELPEAHVVTLRVLDENGNPAPSAEPDIAAKSGGHWFGAGPSKTYLDGEGYLRLEGADEMGAELGGPVLLSATFRDTGATYEKSYTVTEPLDLVVQSGDGFREARSGPETTETQTTESTTVETATTTSTPTIETPTAEPTTKTTVSNRTTEMAMSENATQTGVKRGFLANGESADDYEFLTNPFFLTVGGFVLSVAGIAHNLLRGK